MRNRHPGCGVPDTTQRFLAGLPRRGDPVGAVWCHLSELDRAGNDPTLAAALRAVLLPHQPSRGGGVRCAAHGGDVTRRWLWYRVHVALFSACVTTAERSSAPGDRSAAVSGFPAGHRPASEVPGAQPVPEPALTAPKGTVALSDRPTRPAPPACPKAMREAFRCPV